MGPLLASAMGERWLEYAALAAYLAVLLWIGYRSSRRIRGSEDFALAGRSVPWIVVLATTAATMLGGGASVGMVSEVYQIGIAAAVVSCAWHLQLMFTGLWVAPRLRKLNLITVADYFGVKFGPLARELAVVNSVVFLIGALAAQLVAVGKITETFLDIPYGWALIVASAVTVIYSTVGGMRAVISTDVFQFVILVFGIGIASAILLERNGGFASLFDRVGSSQFQLTSHWSTTKFVGLFAAYLLGETFIPPYAMRCFAAQDSDHARWGVFGAGLFLLAFLPVATIALGLCAQAELPGVEPQAAFPTLMRQTFHPAFSGVMIAALVAAAMSSADSCLAAGATVVMEDVYARHIRKDATDRQLLRVARLTTLFGGLAATVFAFFVRDILDLLQFVYDFWAPAMIVPFLVGVFWYRHSRIYPAVVSMVSGMIAAGVWRLLQQPYELSPALFGFAVAVAAYLVAVPLTRTWLVTPLFEPQPYEEEGG